MTSTQAPAAADLAPFDGTRPQYAGDLKDAEEAGVLPVPAGKRFGKPIRLGWVWASGNLEMSALFLGTLPAVLGLGFGWGLAALAIGMTLGTVPVAILGMWGPQTGTAQIALARAVFGRTIPLPGALQVLSGIGWVAIGCLFGTQAIVKLGLPVWAGALITVGIVAALTIRGYELVLQFTKYAWVLMAALFVLVAAELFRHHTVLPVTGLHGTALAGTFVLMITIAASGSFSWAPYATDYSRYLPASTSRRAVFWWIMAGMITAYVSVSVIGLAAANVIGSNQTAAGVFHLVNGGPVGVIAMLGIALAAVTASTINSYSTTLAAQASGLRVRRQILGFAVGLVAFGGVLWLDTGNTAARFTNLLLFTAYWCAPFCAVVMLDWHYRGRSYTPAYMTELLEWRRLPAGWDALIAFAVGCGAMCFFVNTSVLTGPAATALAGADIAFLVGFVVTGSLYWWLRRYITVPASRGQAMAP